MNATMTTAEAAPVTGYYDYAGLARDVHGDMTENIADCGSRTVLVIVGGYKMLKRWHHHPYRKETESGIIDGDFPVNLYPADANDLEPSFDNSPMGAVVAQVIEHVRKRAEGAVVLVLGFEDPIHVGVIVADVAKKCWTVQYTPQDGKKQVHVPQDEDDAVAAWTAEGGRPVD